jgi:pro-sigmaK processing inhibitor BofA
MLSCAILLTAGLIGIRVLSSPLKLMQKILLNSALGFVSILVFNIVGKQIGVTIGINLFSGTVMAICGPVGLILLLLIRFFTL